MNVDIYVVTYSMIMPGTPQGQVSDLFEFASADINKAEKFFKDLVLTTEYFRKELWIIHVGGRRTLMKEERYRSGT